MEATVHDDECLSGLHGWAALRSEACLAAEIRRPKAEARKRAEVQNPKKAPTAVGTREAQREQFAGWTGGTH